MYEFSSKSVTHTKYKLNTIHLPLHLFHRHKFNLKLKQFDNNAFVRFLWSIKIVQNNFISFKVLELSEKYDILGLWFLK